MHNNYFFLKKLSNALRQKINGWKIGECFSQNKNELIIGLYSNEEQFYIKADQNPNFSCLSFYDSFSRAKKNSIDLFPQIFNMEVKDVIQYLYERAFCLVLENQLTLLFKLYGNFSNILLYKKNTCIDVFKHHLNDEVKINLSELHRNINITKTAFFQSGADPKQLLSSFDNTVNIYLEKQGFSSLGKMAKWDLVLNTLKNLENPSYYIMNVNDLPKFSLLDNGDFFKKYKDPIIAVTKFYLEHQKKYWLLYEKQKIIKSLSVKIRKTASYIKKAEKKLDELQNFIDYRQTADILMANLHRVRQGNSSVELLDFYNNVSIKIKLNPKFSPQKNAEHYYRKSKNQKIEIKTIQKNVEQKKERIHTTQKLLQQIESIDNLKLLRLFKKEHRIEGENKTKIEHPGFKSFDHLGFKILVGRNARNNEDLTFEIGYKDDLWLHAKDVSGSHVLIKYQAGKNFPKPVIEKAAQLAAYYSKNRNASICPVIYTEKKYVRKLKGALPGVVRLDKENVLFIEPADFS